MKLLLLTAIIVIALAMPLKGQEASAGLSGRAGNFTEALARGPFRLWADLSNGEFYIEDARSGRTWRSNPTDRENDWASGFDLQMLQSRVIIYANIYMEEGEVPVSTRYADYASNCEVSYKLTDDALIFVYDFQKPQIKVPVKYTLTDSGFSLELLNNEVVEYGPNRLVQVLALPSFGAAGPEDEGYILIPDGSGALINFNNNKMAADKLSVPVYGFNAGVSDRSASTLEQYKRKKTLGQDVTMPLWGVKVNQDGYLAVITGGAARTNLCAQSGGQGSGYNMAYSSYAYRYIGEVRMLTKGFNQELVNIPEINPDLDRNFRVEYNFLESGASDYTDMAWFFRKYLGLDKALPKGDIPFYLDVYGFIVKRKPRLGIPADTIIPMTRFSQAADIARELDAAGVANIVVKYNYWQEGGYYGKIITEARPEGALGGKDGLESLADYMGTSLFLTHEPINVYKTGNGFFKLFDAHKSIARATQNRFAFSLANASVDSRYEPWYLVRPQKIAQFFDRFLNSFNNAGFGALALDSIGCDLYSELATDGIHRDAVVEIVKAQLAKAEGNLMLNGAFSYAAVYAGHIVNAPARSSGMDIYDADVPFYQIVFHGFKNYSLGAANLASSPGEMKLKALETGASPMFSWVAQYADELIGSRSDRLFSADYSRWLRQAAEEYAELNGVLAEVSGEPITAHRRYGDISVTEYGGRVTVLCNYASVGVDFGGVAIPAKGYIVTDSSPPTDNSPSTDSSPLGKDAFYE
ncbi:MAG: DUF5696 domain-containing protein [Clostridiales bacterium]|jgi:hypothetical protein|nr:DUF5696 domain-containing protein [Clostridiales bacterium]